MSYRPDEYVRPALRVISAPDTECGFDVIDDASGRPLAGITRVTVAKSCGGPQEVTLTFLGIPVDLALPHWEAVVARREAVRQDLARREAAPADPAAALIAGGGA